MLEVLTAEQYLTLSQGKIESSHNVSEKGVFYANLTVVHGYPSPKGEDRSYWSSLTLLIDDSMVGAIKVKPNSVIIPVVLCDIASYDDYITLHFDLRGPITAGRNILVNELMCRISYEKFEEISETGELEFDFDQRYYFELTFLSQDDDYVPLAEQTETKANVEVQIPTT